MNKINSLEEQDVTVLSWLQHEREGKEVSLCQLGIQPSFRWPFDLIHQFYIPILVKPTLLYLQSQTSSKIQKFVGSWRATVYG